MTAEHDQALADQDAREYVLLGFEQVLGQSLAPEQRAFWLCRLESVSPDDLGQALDLVLETYDRQGVPPFAVIRKAVDQVTGVVPAEVKALSEWRWLLDAVRRCGSYNEPDMHPTTYCVVETLGGWSEVCQWTGEDLKHRMKPFLAAWVKSDNYAESMGQGMAVLEAGARRLAVEQSPRRAIGRSALQALQAGQEEEEW
ncbi:MAG: hypothetical protein Q4F72_10760 [Desulfovibrionaceae bacterium]|nr:hypothetical protein [Desulfovibrionaceae bacterium]